MPSAAHQGTTNQYRHVEDEPETEEFLEYHDQQQSSVHLATVEEKKRLWWRSALITGACIAFWYVHYLSHFALITCIRFLFATLLSVYNKWMFSPDRYGFPFPLFVTCLHMWIQFACATLVRMFLPAYFCPPEKPTVKQYG
jgi:solute carrier family 35, member C2